jgi:AraC-like DNA-binding protein
VLAGFHAEVGDEGSGLREAGDQWAGDHARIASHEHATWELYVQVHGSSRWEAAGRRYRLAPGELLAVPPDTPHALAGRPSARHHFAYAALDLERALERTPSLRAAWEPARPRHVAAPPQLQAALRMLIGEVSADRGHRAEGLRTVVDLVVLEATRALSGGPGPARLTGGHPSVRQARLLLEAHPERPWRLAELGREVGLSPTYLAELFSREVGQPPHAYLLDLRLERARELLEAGSLPITAIAQELGFGSSQHFARMFRRRTGRTPSAVRRSGQPVGSNFDASWIQSATNPATEGVIE